MITSRIMDIEIRRDDRKRDIKSYVLRSNTLDEKDKEILEKYGEKHLLFFDDVEKIDSSSVFSNSNPLVMEIGFGMGDSTLKIAMMNENVNYIALDVYLDGVIKLLKNTAEHDVRNLRIMRFNAVDVLTCKVSDDSVDGFHIFFPDPWMKKRHHKRRLMNPSFINLLARKLKKGGYIYFVSDWEEYADEVLDLMSRNESLVNPYTGFAPPVKWRPSTKFEKKGLEKDHVIKEIWFEKR